MDIKSFVSESLTQIIQGIEKSQAENKNSAVNPAPWSSGEERFSKVEFDIAVTVESGTQTKGGIEVFGGMINLGAQGQSKATDVTVSRIKFSVPLMLQFNNRQISIVS